MKGSYHSYLKNRIIRLWEGLPFEGIEDFFKVEEDFGGEFGRRNALIARLLALYNDLVDILQNVRRQVNFDTPTSLETEKFQIKGAVNWSRTCIKNLRNFNPQISEFVYYHPEKRFKTPLNSLLTLTFLQIKKDCEELLYRSKLEEPLLETEKIKLRKIIYSCEKEIGSFPLSSNKSNVIDSMYRSQEKLGQILEKQAKKQLKRERRPNPSYKELLRWRKKYKELEKELGIPQKNFTFTTSSPFHKLYEMWFLLEFIRFLIQEAEVSVKLSKTQDFHFFRIEVHDLRLSLYYQRSEPLEKGWAKIRGLPDYVMVNDHTNEKILLDAKKYEEEDARAIYKMLGYMHNFGVRTGILFFPSLAGDRDLTFIRGERFGVEHCLGKLELRPLATKVKRNKYLLSELFSRITEILTH